MLQKNSPAYKESQPMPGMRVSGMDCPVCKQFIPVSIQQLLFEGSISCPHCGLSLTINRTQSKQALDALQKVQDAVCHLRETEKFRR